MRATTRSPTATQLRRAIVLVAALTAGLWCGSRVYAEFSPPGRLIVVSDESYPPYLFRADDGALQGILVDKWALWSKQTGVPVQVRGTTWTRAQQDVQDDSADVLETPIETEARKRLFDFSSPYAPLEARVYVDRTIAGINDVASMRGFTVGAKNGSACGTWLAEHGVQVDQSYANSEALIRGAGKGESRLFCMDVPVARYFLVKLGLVDQFRETPPLYTQQMHWAVKKGRTELRDFIEQGFRRISTDELARINTHWLGSRVPSPFDLRYLYYGLALVGAIVAAAVLLLLWNRSLRRRVDEKTAELRAALGSVQEYASTVEDLYNHAPCGYHSVDADGVIVRVNDTELNWMGYTREEVVGKKHIFDFITPAGVEQYRELFPKFKELGSISNIEFELLRRDGSTMPLSVASTAVRDAQGRYVMSRTTLYDITERKRAEEALRRLNMELEQRVEERTAELATANKELEAFSYSLSHDLQAPLRAIDGFSAMLSENLGDGIDPEAKDCLNRLRAAGERMGVLIEEMLKLARISHANLHRTRVDLSAMAKDVLVEFRHAEPARKVEVDIAPNIEAFADAGLLRIALQNLLGNAWKYSSKQADARIEFGVLKQGEESVYFVRDNGAGFDSARSARLFTPFQRFHRREEFAGTGIGLATVQRIVSVHGGRIWAESAPGKGARFSFTLDASSSVS